MKKLSKLAVMCILALLCALAFAACGDDDNNNTKYEVTFESNGGSAVEKLTNVDGGAKITKPTDPTKDGYIFGGWYKESSLLNLWNFENDTVTKNITLYAKYILPTPGLKYTKAGEGYEVSKGTATAAEVYIPASYNGLPVIAIAEF